MPLFFALGVFGKKDKPLNDLKSKGDNPNAVEEAPNGRLNLNSNYDMIVSGDLSSIPNAKIAISYREDVRETWSMMERLGPNWLYDFALQVEKSPKMDINQLILLTSNTVKEIYPYNVEKVKDYHKRLGHLPDDARRSFREALFLLGEAADLDFITQKIMHDYSCESGLYKCGVWNFKVLQGGEILVLHDDQGNTSKNPIKFNDMKSFLKITGIDPELIKKVN